MIKKSLFLTILLALSIDSVPVAGETLPYTYKPGDRGQLSVASGKRVQILPWKFLREFDPVTFFFSGKVSGGATGPEVAPQKWVSIFPAHPGEYLWIDEKTLEFRPTVPWPPVSVFTISANDVKQELKTLLATPQSIAPSHGSADIADIKCITIQFAYPVPSEILRKLVSFEITPLPGIDREKSVWFGSADFSIKVGEQESSGAVNYTFNFKNAFPLGQRVRTHVQLSDIKEFSEGKKEYWFDTKSDFRMLRAGSYSAQFNISSTGSNYSVDQALAVDQQGRVILDFSSQPAEISFSDAKSLLMFSPAPWSFNYSLSGSRLIVEAGLEPDRLYKVTLQPVPLKDQLDRKIVMEKPSSFYIYRNPDRQYIRWTKSFSILERFGPQHLPLSLANINSFDLRIYRIDPLHKAYFPFPESPVQVSETDRPPGPGEEPEEETSIYDPLDPSAIAYHIQMLGSPPFSEVIDATGEKISREQTIDLEKKLASISGKDAPGTYLIGFRELSGEPTRQYVKVTVTDLCLSTVESRGEILFSVTSLSTGKPVTGARVRIEGMKKDAFVSLVEKETDNSGLCTVGSGFIHDEKWFPAIKRVIISKDDDVLVLDSRENQAPPQFADNHWQETQEGWLDCLVNKAYNFERDRVVKGFVFPERPIYRPDEKVFIKGYIRSLHMGKILKLPYGKVELHIQSPDGTEWNESVALSDVGSFNYTLEEDELVTGEFTITLVWVPEKPDESLQTVASATFRVDAYRVPRFEVKLNGPDQVPNDEPFTTNLTASYYAGGRVIDCQAEWKVRIFPYTWQLDGWEEYAISSDSRYGRSLSSTDFGTVNEVMKTDDEGSARLVLQTPASLGANPAKYVIEATVTDVDEQTVTDVHSVVALPPFVLALKTDRYVTGSGSISARLAAISTVTQEPVSGQSVKVVLKKMTWHSYLQETDFARSEPHYITEENVELVEERTVVTTAKPLEIVYEDRDAGVYIIELSATDKLGRLQTLRIDLFLAGKKPVVWQKSQQKVFETVTDKKEYAPGDVAKIILKSPYQNGSALAVVEHPDGTPRYSWVTIKNGFAEFSLQVEAEMLPQIPVSFLLMRPRISDVKRIPGGGYVDAGKPESVANTTWLTVKPNANLVTVSLVHDKVQAPGDTMELELKLSDWKGKPLGGEVALWLVDEAVLALGEEMDLNPLRQFIPEVGTHLKIRDTRNLALGRLRDFERPGGDEAEAEGEAADVQITVRKNFKTVPYYEPSLIIGNKGTISIKIPLPDNLTRFAVRAVAVSGIERFGLAKSSVAVRLPVIVQPSLPRFVRVGDRFTAGGVARVVEGTGGRGSFSYEAEGLSVVSEQKSGAWHEITFPGKKAQPVYMKLKVDDVKYARDGTPEKDSVTLQMAVRKKGSNKGDAFRVSIPLLADRQPVTRKTAGYIKKDTAFSFAKISQKYRDNTLVRQLQISKEAAMISVLSGLRYLLEYPHGCAEQRISRAYPSFMFQELWRKLGLEQLDPGIDRHIEATLEYLEKIQDETGLFAYWPGNRGEVHLTAYAVEFMAAVKKYHNAESSSYRLNESVYQRAVEALERSLRSDHTNLIDGYGYFERCAAMFALVRAGKNDMAYLRQLASHSREVDIESKARIYTAIVESGQPMDDVLKELEKELWKAPVFKRKLLKEEYAGLQSGSNRIGARVHTSEISALAALVSALSKKSSKPDKVALMSSALVTYGQRDGWGNTHSNGVALLALYDRLTNLSAKEKDATLTLVLDGKSTGLTYTGQKGMLYHSFAASGAGELQCGKKSDKDSFYVKLFERYLPVEPGSRIKAKQEGFVVQRQTIYPSGTKAPSRKVWIDTVEQRIRLKPGDVIEDHVQVTNPSQRHFVAVVIPLAAGVEYLNPELKTASSESASEGKTTSSGSYTMFLDDRMVYYFTTMNPGTYDFYFRVRATTEGVFTQPPAKAEMMYEEEVYGNSLGAEVVVAPDK